MDNKKALLKVYLCIPYSGMEESSYLQANLGTVAVLENGHNVYSPITHSHPLTKLTENKLPGNWEFWSAIDYQFIDWADELWVLIPTEGEERVLNSTGVQAEIKYAIEKGKSVKYMKQVNKAYAVNSDITFGRRLHNDVVTGEDLLKTTFIGRSPLTKEQLLK